jgi:hypothetical protein
VVTLSKFTISAIVHLHTIGLKEFVTLLGEKGFPPPNGLAVESGWYFTTTQNHFSSATQREPDSQKSSFKERLAQDTSESTPPAAHLILSSMCG